MGAASDSSMDAIYDYATINDRMLGHAEPIRVRAGQRVLFRVLNASATVTHWLALSGHDLDGDGHGWQSCAGAGEDKGVAAGSGRAARFSGRDESARACGCWARRERRSARSAWASSWNTPGSRASRSGSSLRRRCGTIGPSRSREAATTEPDVTDTAGLHLEIPRTRRLRLLDDQRQVISEDRNDPARRGQALPACDAEPQHRRSSDTSAPAHV